MSSCTICKEPATIIIPTLNEPLLLCTNHIAQPPIDVIQTLFRDCTTDTLLYLLGFVHQKFLLEKAIQEQAQKVKEIEIATKFNLIESLRLDRDALDARATDLESSLKEAQSALVLLQNENKNLANIHALLEEHRNALSFEINKVKSETIAHIDETKEFIETINEDIQTIQDILTKEPEPDEPAQKSRKERQKEKTDAETSS